MRRGRKRGRRRNPFGLGTVTRTNPKIMGLPPVFVYGAAAYVGYKKLIKKEKVFPGTSF